MLKFMCKCSSSNSINGFRSLRHVFSATSYSSISTIQQQQQQQQQLPSSFLPNFFVENLGFTERQSLSFSARIAAGWQADAGHPRRVSSLTFAANANSVINFFESHGFHDSQIRKVVSCDPRILTFRVDKTLIPKFKVLQDLGISGSDLISVISANPKLITGHLEPVLQDWRVFLGTPDNVVSFFKRRRSFLASSLRLGHLLSNVRLLEKDYGISTDIIRFHVVRHERAFLRKPELFRKILMEVEHKWGISPSSGMFLYAVNIFGRLSAEYIESKIRLFKSFGWNQSHITTIINKFPHCLGISETRLTKSLEFLMNEMGYDPAFLACRPSLFTYSLETRLLPRHRILVGLREEGLIANECSLYTVVKLTEPKFFHTFVQPFKDDLPDLYQEYFAIRGCQTNEMERGAA